MSSASVMSYITYKDVINLCNNKSSRDVMIFLSGPTSLNTPLSALKNNDVITVNGAAKYLLQKEISPYIYVLTDSRFIKERRNEFYEYSKRSKFTIINTEVYENGSPEDIEYFNKMCYIIMPLYKREKGGIFKRLNLHRFAKRNDSIFINVPWSKKKRLVGFSKDITLGYCSCHTVAYAAVQIAYSLDYERIIFSGLDMTGSCSRFYDEGDKPLPSELNRDLPKILPFFSYMKQQVPDIKIFNLSDNTAISYDIIPHISRDDLNIN